VSHLITFSRVIEFSASRPQPCVHTTTTANDERQITLLRINFRRGPYHRPLAAVEVRLDCGSTGESALPSLSRALSWALN
jgi:hypothetical protein